MRKRANQPKTTPRFQNENRGLHLGFPGQLPQLGYPSPALWADVGLGKHTVVTCSGAVLAERREETMGRAGEGDSFSLGTLGNPSEWRVCARMCVCVNVCAPMHTYTETENNR